MLITDPDDLDRYQVVFDPVQQLITIGSLGAARLTKKTDGATTTGTGTFTSASGSFVTNGVVAGDKLAIVSGSAVIGHYTVSSRDSATQLTVTPTFSASETSLTYRVFQAGQTVGPSGGTLGDGATGKSVYSFAKEERRTLIESGFPDLLQFDAPFEPLGDETFEIGGGGQDHSNWNIKDVGSRKKIRTAGWTKKDQADTVKEIWTGIVTIGTLDADSQCYYLQTAGGTPVNFTGKGAVNEPIQVFQDGGSDVRTFLKIFNRKKKRFYVQSALADIGVSTLSGKVERFGVGGHETADPAIVLDDGQLAGDGTNTVFQAVETHSSGSNGATVDNGDGTFSITSATVSPAWNDGVLRVGDTVQITSGGYQGHYQISALVDADTVTLFHEPGKTYPGNETSLTFTVRTAVRDTGGVNATLADVNGATGTLTASGKTFNADNGLGNRTVVAGDMVVVTAGTGAVIGVYKVISVDSATQLTLNTSDQAFAGQTNQTYVVLRPGMHLQFFETNATQVSGVNITFNDNGGDGRPRIVRASGSFTTDGYKKGMTVKITGSASQTNGSFKYTIDQVVSATELALVPTDVLVDEGPSGGITINGRTGVIRTLNGRDYSFHWRLFGNGGTLAQCYQWIQRQLRRTTDIDEGNASSRGDITDLLMTFSNPLGRALDMHIDDLAASDKNNATFVDLTSTARNFAFLAGITITLNANLTNDANAVVRVFFASVPSGNYGTSNAVVVQDVNSNPMEDTTPLANPLQFSFDFDNNAQGGRTPGTNADIVIVASGTDKAQAKKVTGTITRTSNNAFSVDAALERTYSNP